MLIWDNRLVIILFPFFIERLSGNHFAIIITITKNKWPYKLFVKCRQQPWVKDIFLRLPTVVSGKKTNINHLVLKQIEEQDFWVHWRLKFWKLHLSNVFWNSLKLNFDFTIVYYSFCSNNLQKSSFFFQTFRSQHIYLTQASKKKKFRKRKPQCV